MAAVLKVTVPGKPVPYGRARHRGSHHWHGKAHTTWEALAVALMRRALRGQAPTEAPHGYRVTIEAYYPSKSASKAQRGQLKASARGDLDNVAKLVLDAAVKAGALPDDRLVSQLWCIRRWAEQPDQARVVVFINPAQEAPWTCPECAHLTE